MCRQYEIVLEDQGGFQSYDILTGPANADMQALFNEFQTAYGYDSLPTRGRERIEADTACMYRAIADGCGKSASIMSLFAGWLVKYKGFLETESVGVFLDDMSRTLTVSKADDDAE